MVAVQMPQIKPFYFRVGLAAGIGATINQAESALHAAKDLKKDLLDSDSREVARETVEEAITQGRYAIRTFREGDLLCDLVEPNDHALINKVGKAVNTLRDLERRYGRNSVAYQAAYDLLNDHARDDGTGALTPFGYVLHSFLHPIAVPDGHQSLKVIVDANDMHYWNANVGYEAVTHHLQAIGAALVHDTRTISAGESPEQRSVSVSDMVSRRAVTRTHGSAGDEFMIDLICPTEKAEDVVKRLFTAAYTAQDKLYHQR